MRKIILFNLISLDGRFEGENHDIDWHNVDDEFNQFAIDQLRSAGALVFGRITYELMASYWPTAGAQTDDPVVAGWMNKLPKYVFSKTLSKVDWNNTTLISGDAVTEIKRIKQEPGKDLFIFGSADLAKTFFHYGLIDEIRILVNPLILGKGTPLFKPQTSNLSLQLVNARTFKNGNVLLIYSVDKGMTSSESIGFE